MPSQNCPASAKKRKRTREEVPFLGRPAVLLAAALGAFTLALLAKTTASVLPAVLLVGVLFDGGDWPPATFLVRVSLFLAVALILRARDEVTVRPTMPDLLVAAFWGLAALSLFRGAYRWVTYQWILHFTAAAALYVSVRALPPDAEGRFPDVLGRTVVACALGLSVIALFQWAVLGRSRPPATTIPGLQSLQRLS